MTDRPPETPPETAGETGSGAAHPAEPAEAPAPGELFVASDTDTGGLEEPHISLQADIWRRFRKNRLAMLGLGLLIIIILAAVFADVICKYDPATIDPAHARQPPSSVHWFGTDSIGRDMFARVIFGARVSLRVGIFSVIIATAIGILMGALSGFYGGIIDTLIMRFTDIFLAFPYILAALAIIAVVGPGERTVILVLGLLGWLAIARVLRSTILQIKESEYIEAARALGYSDRRIITRHILPNAIQPVIVYSTLFTGTAVLSEAALSFLGVGIQEPTPAWGLMVAQGKRFLSVSPHLLFFPGAAIFVMVMAFVFVGDGLRDALDPRLK